MLYLLRVGADSVYGGFHSPIFQDLSYLFIPIPDNNVLKEKSIRYSEYKWNNKDILSYIPIKLRKKLSSYTIHNDPEFVTCTYGSPRYDKRGIEKNYKKLLNLKENDLLVFYAAFSNKFEDRNESISGLYFFAYFVIDTIIEYTTPESLKEDQKRLISNNHHYIHKMKTPVIVVGNCKKSRVFEKVVLLSSKQYDRDGSNYYPCDEIKEMLSGYNKSFNFSSLREFMHPSIKKEFKDYLDNKSGRNMLSTINAATYYSK